MLSCLLGTQRSPFLLRWRCSPSQYAKANHSTQGWRSGITGPRAAASTSSLPPHSLLPTPSYTGPLLQLHHRFSPSPAQDGIYLKILRSFFLPCSFSRLPMPYWRLTLIPDSWKKETQMSLFEIILNAWLAVTLPVLINLFEEEVSTLQWSWQRLATNLFAFSAKMIYED